MGQPEPTNAIRESKLELIKIPNQDFLDFARRAHRSVEVGGVKSQYIDRLKLNDPGVGALGYLACDRLIGVLSYGVHALPRNPNGHSGRLDIVATDPVLRGMGVASLLTSHFFDWLLEQYGEGLKEVSTIALHPAVVKIVTQFGFLPPPAGMETPRYSIDLEIPGKFEEFQKMVRHETTVRMQKFRLECIRCKQFRWTTPWCRPELKRKK